MVDGLPPGRSPAAAGITCALCPFGTGNDWVRTHGLPRRPHAWLQHFLAARPRLQNLGILHYTDPAGPPAHRVFTNVAGLAYDAHVVRAAGRHAAGARWRYPLLTVTQLPRYRPAPARLTYDGQVAEAAFHTINFGIGRYSGGGMRLVPQADPTAETFALTYVPRLSIPRILLNGYRFYTGTIGGLGPVVTTHARTASVTQLDPDPARLSRSRRRVFGPNARPHGTLARCVVLRLIAGHGEVTVILGVPPPERRRRSPPGFADRSALRALTPLQAPHAGGSAAAGRLDARYR